jgi:hypothetical protein
MGSYGECMEGEVYNFNQSTIILHGRFLAMQKALVEKLNVQMSQEGNPHATVSMHLIEKQHHKKPVIINRTEISKHVLNGVEDGHVICVPIIGTKVTLVFMEIPILYAKVHVNK